MVAQMQETSSALSSGSAPHPSQLKDAESDDSRNETQTLAEPRTLNRPALIEVGGGLFDGEAFFGKFRAWRQDPRVVLGALVTLAIIGGYAWLQLGTPHGVPSSLTPPSSIARPETSARGDSAQSSTTGSGATSVKVVAHVAGAVVTPGIVTLKEGQRVVDAIGAAGGARPDADVDQLNLAARVADGERIFVPVRGAPIIAAASSGGSVLGSSNSPSGPIHLNSATSAELETLPGIGPSLASAIMKLRADRGGFRSVGDLRDVPGIGDARFSQLESQVAL
ncbi:MAG: ComEA family DNA-binding protein [Actinobacteria bacterium]|nr:ComEA family DNA-binding protein [Actinomycetota bacterium]MSY07090.1 ComEA family DNA-binding protein [Actinomycetota bacterium]